MNASPPLAEPVHPAKVLAVRVDAILDALNLLVAARFRDLGGLTVPLWKRIARARQRLAALLALLAAGGLPRRGVSRPGRRGGAPPPRFPRRWNWLVEVLGYQAANYAQGLRAALHEPAVQSTLAATPGIGRTLRPLCRMLGVALPPALRPPPSAPPPPAPSPPTPSRSAQPRAGGALSAGSDAPCPRDPAPCPPGGLSNADVPSPRPFSGGVAVQPDCVLNVPK